MTDKFNEEELYLLKRWEDVVKCRKVVEKLYSRYQELIEKKIKEEWDWWNHDEFEILFYPEKNANDVSVHKKSWKCGSDKWNFVGLGLANIDFDSIIGHGDDYPSAYIWTKKVKNLGVDLDKFNAAIRKEVKDIFPSQIKEWENWKSGIGFYIPQREELKNALRKGEFIDIIDIFIENLNTLGKCIKPIDKTMEKYCHR